MNLFTSQNMVRVVIYAVSEQDARGARAMLRQAIQSRRQWPLIQSFPGDFSGFLRYVEGNPYLIMLAAVPGPSGARLVRQIRAVNPDARRSGSRTGKRPRRVRRARHGLRAAPGGRRYARAGARRLQCPPPCGRFARIA